MSKPENPERLIARVHADGSGMVCVYAVPQYASPPTQVTWVPYEPSKPSDYIRSDRAAAEMAAQVEINAALHDYSDDITVRLCQMAEDLGMKSEPLEIGPDAAEILSAIHDVLDERAALRRERDALRDRLEAMRRGLDDVKDATRGEDYGSDCGSEDANRAWDIARLALEADDEASRAAGKGAG